MCFENFRVFQLPCFFLKIYGIIFEVVVTLTLVIVVGQNMFKMIKVTELEHKQVPVKIIFYLHI